MYRGVMKLYKWCPDVDGIFVSGGCLRTLEIIDILGKYKGLPVVTSNPVVMWRCLQLVGIRELIYGFGKLLEMPR